MAFSFEEAPCGPTTSVGGSTRFFTGFSEEGMNRREFLARTAFFLIGGFLKVNDLPKAQAFDDLNSDSAIEPRISLIIDDIGPNLSGAKWFLDLNIPITFAVLPRLCKSEEAATLVHDAGHEIMLHQPMEPDDRHLDPGPGALFVGYGSNKIVRIMEENISLIPFAAGVNNHMGSRFTRYSGEVLETLQVVKEKGLFFVDSLTTSRSKAFETARNLNVPAASRNVFLDNILEESAIVHQLSLLKKRALKQGHSVGIGHPFPETARAIRSFLKEPAEAGFTWVYVSRLIENG
jgi:polysaccharide deacetylase 2 family uncharacterized protein YibQ